MTVPQRQGEPRPALEVIPGAARRPRYKISHWVLFGLAVVIADRDDLIVANGQCGMLGKTRIDGQYDAVTEHNRACRQARAITRLRAAATTPERKACNGPRTGLNELSSIYCH